MNDSLRLSVPDLNDEDAAAEFYRVADAAHETDGYDPFNEQSRLDVASGRRTPIVATAWSVGEHGRAVGAAIVGRGELDFVIDPVFRGKGYGDVALRGLLPTAKGELTAWSHGDHPAARTLADKHGFDKTRTLLQLRLAPLPDRRHQTETHAAPGITIARFTPETDIDEWVALNAQVFATHPEQGAVSANDVRERMQESWFNAEDFLIARDETGAMVGYNWLKIEPGSPSGEVYVIGVSKASAGLGLGRELMHAGLDRLADAGCTEATLYVEADNERAVHLYASLGFVQHTVDVQYTGHGG